VTLLTHRASFRSASCAAVVAMGIVVLVGCSSSSSTPAASNQPASSTATAAASTATAAPSAAADAVTCPTAAAVSSAAGVTYAKLEVTPPSSGFPQTSCAYSAANQALEVGLYPAGTTLSSLTSVATGTLTQVQGLGSQADSTTTPDSAVYVYRSSGAYSVVDQANSLSVSQVEAVAKIVLAG
jgi:hypothetical protein